MATQDEIRRERLKAALRENLKRRKAKTRARAEAKAAETVDDETAVVSPRPGRRDED